jgi:hypothetical protein
MSVNDESSPKPGREEPRRNDRHGADCFDFVRERVDPAAPLGELKADRSFTDR